MLSAFFWGFIATTSLILGGIFGSWFKIGRRPLGLIMAFGSGVLVIAVAGWVVSRVLQEITCREGTLLSTVSM